MILAEHVPAFIEEKKFLKNVSPTTLNWYKYSLQAFEPVLKLDLATTHDIKAAVIKRIAELQTEGRGNTATSVNTYLRCLKAFLNWCHTEGILKERVKLSWLKEERKVITTLTPEQVKRIVDWKPSNGFERRLHLLMLVQLDCGLRFAECLTLRTESVDLDNCVLRVNGKGNKQRLVPFSLELRKKLFRHLQTDGKEPGYLFRSTSGGRLQQRNLLRQYKRAAKKLGISGLRFSPHTLRHSFAVAYLRAGGNIFYLSRMLGHTSLEMSKRYLESLGVDDLKAVHNGLSLLSR